MRRILHALLQGCRQRPGIALAPLIFCLYGPSLWFGSDQGEQWSVFFQEQMGVNPLGTKAPAFDLFAMESLLGRIDTALGASAFAAHLHSLLWMVATIGALRLALRYSCDLGERCTSWIAMMTLFIYASTSTAATTVCWIAQRPILISACFGWLSLATLAASTQSTRNRSSLLSPLFLALSLWSSAGGIMAFMFVLCYAVWGDPRGIRERLSSIVPHTFLALAWSYFAYQFVPEQSGVRCNLQGTFGRLTRLLAELLAWLPPRPAQCLEPRVYVYATGLAALALAGLFFRWIITKASPNHVRSLRWSAAGALLSIIPALCFAADGRYLLFASLGASFLFASGIRRCGQAMREHKLFALLLGLGLLRHFVLAPIYTFLFALFLANWTLKSEEKREDEVSSRYAAAQMRFCLAQDSYNNRGKDSP